MYEKIVEGLEIDLLGNYERAVHDYEQMAQLADLIIKIKTIQALDTSADLIRASRQVGRN